MSYIRLYFDEDAMQQSLVIALRARHVDVAIALDQDMINRPDSEHLLHATNDGRVLYSFNIGDFSALHNQWLDRQQPHCGIVLAARQRYSVGEQLRRLLRLVAACSAEDMNSRLEHLSSWGH